MPYINKIATLVPEFKHQQNEILQYMLQFSTQENISRKLKAVYQKSNINQRYSVLNEFSSLNPQKSIIDYTTKERLKIYQAEAPILSQTLINKYLSAEELNQLTHLITVSCTGMYAPGLDIDLVKSLNLKPDINRTSINFMGCYAVFHAFKMADQICKSQKNASVLVLSCELCTLHFQNNESDNNLIANSLFADGIASCIISNQKTGIKIQNLFSKIWDIAYHDMSWYIGNTGFEMYINKNVPQMIETYIKSFLLDNQIEIDDPNLQFLVHPGGYQIIDNIQKAMQLQASQLSHSLNILQNFGNMSSATILFVLQDWLNEKSNTSKGIALAFGPGLVVEAAEFEKI